MKKVLKIFLLMSLLLTILTVSLNTQDFKGWATSKLQRVVIRQWLVFRDYTTGFLMRGHRALGDTTWTAGNTVTIRGVDCFWGWNTYGDTLFRGDVVLWDQTIIEVADTVAYTADPQVIAVADDISSEDSPCRLFITTFSLGDACSLDIVGIPYGSASSTTETVVFTVDATKYTTTVRYWTSITSINARSLATNDSVFVGGENSMCIYAAASADDPLVAGVVYSSSILDNTLGLIAFSGPIDSVKLDCSSEAGAVGKPLQTIATAEKGGPVATVTDGATFGRMLESGNTDDYYRVFLKQE